MFSSIEAGFGRIVESEIRINRKNNRQSLLPCLRQNSSEKDGMILMPVIARRYAFEGDIV
ncbi:hypothetical protein CVS40_8441 [Lucilia cuprina]|nr:hypothetical protein CVS40_8441 [Lucilia cuprina]